MDNRVHAAHYRLQLTTSRLMENENLKRRTRSFALEIIKMVEKLPKDDVGRVLGRQLLKSGTSVGANYRSVCRAKSTADFISKFGTVEEEADESGFWLDLLVEAGKVNASVAAPLIQ